MLNKDYILSLLDKGLRVDGRKFVEYRAIKIETGVSSKSADGSAKVTIGDTEVIAGVKLEVGEPYPDTPNEGAIMVNVELVPLASPEFESGPPDIASIELARVVDRGIRESNALDFKKLCIKEKEKVWLVFIDIYPLNDCGNLFDASALAALAALKNTRFPKYDKKEEKIIYEEKTEESFNIEKLPVSCTLIKIKDKIIVDPNPEEEMAMEARLTVATLGDGSICAMQKGGPKPLSVEDASKMIDLAIEKGEELRKLL